MCCRASQGVSREYLGFQERYRDSPGVLNKGFQGVSQDFKGDSRGLRGISSRGS